LSPEPYTLLSFACHEQDASFQLRGPNVTGGAPEHIRYLFIVAGREDELDDSALYDIDFSKMREGGLAAACPAFVHAKASGQLDANMGRMPVMLVDGVPIGQIPVIKRIVAKRMGLYSDNEVEAAQIDMINEHLIDVKKEYNDTKKLGEEAVAKWFQAKLPEWMGKLEKCVGGKGFAVGSKVTWADVELFTFITAFFDNKEGAAASIQACPKIKNSVALIKNLPAMRAHLAKRAAKAP
jgi:glutathione S-transferase